MATTNERDLNSADLDDGDTGPSCHDVDCKERENLERDGRYHYCPAHLAELIAAEGQ